MILISDIFSLETQTEIIVDVMHNYRRISEIMHGYNIFVFNAMLFSFIIARIFLLFNAMLFSFIFFLSVRNYPVLYKRFKRERFFLN